MEQVSSTVIDLRAHAGSTLGQQLDERLTRQLRETIGSDRYGPEARLVDWHDGLLDGVADGLPARSLNGAGQSRLERPETGAAITLNSFLPWLGHLPALRLRGMAGFRELHFDARCPTGIRGTPPHIEVLATGPGGVTGVTSRSFGYLNARPARLAAAYGTVQASPGMAPWLALLQDKAPGGRFRHLDVAALAKQALGLVRIFPDRPVQLLYLFLEPVEAGRWPVFAAHRAELARLGEQTRGTPVRFAACSFHELWADWADSEEPRLAALADTLSLRYAVALPAATEP